MILNITVAIWAAVMFILLPACSKKKELAAAVNEKIHCQTCVLPVSRLLYPTLV